MVGLIFFCAYLVMGGVCSLLFKKAIHAALQVSPKRKPMLREEIDGWKRVLLWQQDIKYVLRQGKVDFFGSWKWIASLLIILFWLPLSIHLLWNREGK